jgi:hypothetical protein
MFSKKGQSHCLLKEGSCKLSSYSKLANEVENEMFYEIAVPFYCFKNSETKRLSFFLLQFEVSFSFVFLIMLEGENQMVVAKDRGGDRTQNLMIIIFSVIY